MVIRSRLYYRQRGERYSFFTIVEITPLLVCHKYVFSLKDGDVLTEYSEVFVFDLQSELYLLWLSIIVASVCLLLTSGMSTRLPLKLSSLFYHNIKEVKRPKKHGIYLLGCQ